MAYHGSSSLLSVTNETVLGNASGMPQSYLRSTPFFIIGALLCFIGTTGNSLFVITFLLDKKLHTISNYLICLLTIADLLACLGYILVHLIIVGGQFDIFTCQIWLLTMPLFPMLSMYSQLLISIERMTLVTQPFDVYRRWFSTKLCSCYAFGGCLTTVCIVTLLVSFSERHTDSGKQRCSAFDGLSVARYQAISTYMTFCGICFGFAVIFYGKLLLYVRKKRLEFLSHSLKRAYIRTSVTLLKLCILSIVTALIPPVIVYSSIALRYNFALSETMVQIGMLGSFPGFCVNPIVYAYSIAAFRCSLRKMCCSCPKNKVQVQVSQGC